MSCWKCGSAGAPAQDEATHRAVCRGALEHAVQLETHPGGHGAQEIGPIRGRPRSKRRSRRAGRAPGDWAG